MKAKIEIEFDTEEPFDLEKIRRHLACDDVVALLYNLVHSGETPDNISEYVHKLMDSNGINFEDIWT